jgi:hypothetical protein
VIVAEDIVTQFVLLRAVPITHSLLNIFETNTEETPQINQALNMKVIPALVLVTFDQEFNIFFLLTDLALSAHLECFINNLVSQRKYFLGKK